MKKFIKSDTYTGFAKTDDAIIFEAALNKHFTKLFGTKNPTKFSENFRELLKCQLNISLDVQKSTTDEKLKIILEDYITNLKKTLSKDNLYAPITTSNKNEFNLLLLKSFDIETLKSINTLNIEYDLNIHETYSCYIKYLIYTHDQNPDAYDTFIPTLENFMHYDSNIYINQVRYE
ncbi:MAG: hypothetical protein ACRCWG_04250 [Sarcina sp.]